MRNSLLLPGPFTQVAVFKKGEWEIYKGGKLCELTIFQAERITENGNVIPAKSITIRGFEAIDMLSVFLLDMLADPGKEPPQR